MKYRFLAGVLMLTPAHALAAEDSLQPIVDYVVDERFCETNMPEPGILNPKLEAAMRGSGLTSAEVMRIAREKAKDLERKLVMEGVDQEGYCEGRDFTRKEEWDDYQAAYPDAANDGDDLAAAQSAETPTPTKPAEDTLAPDARAQRKPNPVKLVLRSRVNAVVCNFKDSSDFMFNSALIKAAEALEMSPRAAYEHLTREAYKLASETINSEQDRAYFCMMTRAQATSELFNSFGGGKAPRMEVNPQRDFPDWGKQ